MRIFGIDPGSERTGYGCVETDGRRPHLVLCGAITAPAHDPFPQRLARIHRELLALLVRCRPSYVAIESLFHAVNARSALKLGQARGVAILAAVQAGCEVVEYTPAEVKRAVVGYGRAEKHQVQQMMKLLLGLKAPPSPHDVADALAVAICHLHSMPKAALDDAGHNGAADLSASASLRRDLVEARTAREGGQIGRRHAKSWRHYRPPATG